MYLARRPLIESVAYVQQHVNMLCTVDDFWDNWHMLKNYFDVFKRWNAYRIPGSWPDGDKLPFGRIGIRTERGDNRMSRFSRDEQYIDEPMVYFSLTADVWRGFAQQ